MGRFGEDWALFVVAATLAICQRGAAIEGKCCQFPWPAVELSIGVGTRAWHEEKMLEKSNYASGSTQLARAPPPPWSAQTE